MDNGGQGFGKAKIGKYYITVSSRTGRFNLADPSQESTSTHLEVKDINTDEKIKSINIQTDYQVVADIINPNSFPYEVLSLVKKEIKRYWISTSRKEDEEFKKFLEDNIEGFVEGQIEHTKRYHRDMEEEHRASIEELERRFPTIINIKE